MRASLSCKNYQKVLLLLINVVSSLRININNNAMGQLAFLRMFILVAISLDVNDNRRHVHVFWKGKRHQHSLAKIWIERNGLQCVEIAESELSAKDNEMLVNAINRHWKFINDQITKVFNGEKTISLNIEN